ncbi:MAG TPA: PD-(D/E)XK nuclease family protein [Solirubrobacteraceae bacterium]|nr:PD-(D/E)XK nuclease family protein [Solirubrobacteraceae bacterium]
MTLTLITGPANSAKAGEVFAAYAAATRRGAALVVPTAQDARHYERELAAGAPGRAAVVFGAVLTFDGLIGRIAERTGYGGRRLSALQRERVLGAVIARLRDEGLHSLAASARGSGFAPAAGELIAELQRSLVTPQRFTQALRAWAAQDVRHAGFTRDLGRIYAAYARALEALGRVDRELFAWRALDALRADPESFTRPTADAVFVYGFDDLTPLERDAVQTLARIPGVEVTVSLTYEPGRTALAARAEAVEDLRPLADAVRELPASAEHYAPSARSVLHRLERDLFQDGPPAGDPPEPAEAGAGEPGAVVTLLEAGGSRAEAELIAGEILALRGPAGDGMPFSEIVLVHRAPSSVGGLFARVLSGYGIPLAAARTTELRHTPLGRAMLGAARCAWLGAEATPADLLAYLRAPGLLQRADVADGLEAAIRQVPLTTVAAAREALGWELGELDSLAAAARTELPAPDVPVVRLSPGGGAVTELRRLAQRLLAAPHRGAASQFEPDEELDGRAFAALSRALDELAELTELDPGGAGAGSRLPAAELIELLGGLAVELSVADGCSAVDGVRLVAPAEIRARRFRAVFICGLQEGEFPAPGHPEPFLSDEWRRELALASGLALRAREDALEAERYLFYSALSRASERVFLSYRSSDEEGNLALASPFIADVAAVLDRLGIDLRARRRRRLLADVTWPPDDAPTAREAARAAAAARAPLTGEPPEPARRLGAAALAHVRHTRIVSAGALERYSDCPVRWLVEAELDPTPLEPEAEPLARGSLIHGVLEALIAELGAPVTAGTLERARAILAREIAALAQAGGGFASGVPEVVRAGALRGVQADVERYLEHEADRGSGWTPHALEWRFGFESEDGSSLPALVLGAGEDEVRVRGVVDRVDVEPGNGAAGAGRRAIVRDYKSGAPQANWPVARWGLERRLQVALYMLVVRHLAHLDPVAGLYQPLRGEDLRPRGAVRDDVALGPEIHPRDVRSAADLDAELDAAAERAIALARGLRSGAVAPCPATCSRDGCAHPAICRSR